MWNHIPFDVLSHILSLLPPPSLARASATCTHWRSCSASLEVTPRPPLWLLLLPIRTTASSRCHALDPDLGRWHSLDLNFLPCPIRPVAPIGGLLLCKLASRGGSPLRLALCNPFTRQYRLLPAMRNPRSNPAVGIVAERGRVYVAGGMSPGGAYEPTVEVYDGNNWEVAGGMPAEFAVRMTVWTPGEGVHAGGTLYWMTSARAFSVMGFDIARRTWMEVRAPMAERLDRAALVARSGGRVGVVGGEEGEGGAIWELDGEGWRVVGKFVGSVLGRTGEGWGCVGGDGFIYMFRELGSTISVWRGEGNGEEDGWEWVRAERSCSGPGAAMKGALIYPSLSHGCINSDLGSCSFAPTT